MALGHRVPRWRSPGEYTTELLLPRLETVFFNRLRIPSWDMEGASPNSTTLFARSRRVQWSWPVCTPGQEVLCYIGYQASHFAASWGSFPRESVVPTGLVEFSSHGCHPSSTLLKKGSNLENNYQNRVVVLVGLADTPVMSRHLGRPQPLRHQRAHGG